MIFKRQSVLLFFLGLPEIYTMFMMRYYLLHIRVIAYNGWRVCEVPLLLSSIGNSNKSLAVALGEVSTANEPHIRLLSECESTEAESSAASLFHLSHQRVIGIKLAASIL